VLFQNACVSYSPSQVLGDQKLFDEIWRMAVKRTHPDFNGERDGGDFNRVINARERIKTLKGWQ